MVDNLENRMGLSHKLTVKCTSCNWNIARYSSNTTKLGAQGGRPFFKSNSRVVTAFREIGKGHEGIQSFARIMNMHGISNPAYINIKDDLTAAYQNAAEASMKNAAERVHNDSKEKLPQDHSIALCDVSIDGTWQKRGHASLNGVVKAISDGLCLDKHVMSKYCKLCNIWESKKGTPEYHQWRLEHNCKQNHVFRCHGECRSNLSIHIIIIWETRSVSAKLGHPVFLFPLRFDSFECPC